MVKLRRISASAEASTPWAYGEIYLMGIDQPTDQLFQQELADFTPSLPHALIRFWAIGGKPASVGLPPARERSESQATADEVAVE